MTDDPDLGKIGPGHICKHGVRWPHACHECDDAAWRLKQQREAAQKLFGPNPDHIEPDRMRRSIHRSHRGEGYNDLD